MTKDDYLHRIKEIKAALKVNPPDRVGLLERIVDVQMELLDKCLKYLPEEEI